MKSWFERLTGFAEADYETTRSKLAVRDDRLHSLVDERSYGVGTLELVSLATLRTRAATAVEGTRIKVGVFEGDVRRLHRRSDNTGALFQVASQFNLLEMIHPTVTPEMGVSGYQNDPTQGPACAIAAGAATIFRNYFTPFADGIGQTRDRQIDGARGLGERLSELTGRPVDGLWKMQNGYALCTSDGLAAINVVLDALDDDALDELRGALRIGVHAGVEVTDDPEDEGMRVTQAFCSALPVAYGRAGPSRSWGPFARLVLEAAYEATLRAAAENHAHGGSNRVYLTLLGGGAFGNERAWIDDAILRALDVMRPFPLDVRIVVLDARSVSGLLSEIRDRGIPADDLV